VGYEGSHHDERPWARIVARYFGTRHEELVVSAADAGDVLARLGNLLDEPLADMSFVPLHLLSRAARGTVTVALTGDGGDELFAGYPRYAWTERVARALAAIPAPLHTPIASALRALSPAAWNRLLRRVPARWRGPLSGDKLHKAAALIEHPAPEAVYRRMVSQWDKPDEVAAAGNEPHGPLWDATLARDFPDIVPRLQYLDMVTYLPDDILTKVDRATMAVALEGRVPLLDHRVVAYSWSLPLHFKLRHGQSKWLLRRVLDRYVPQRLIDRPKMGFGVPIDSWLRGPLREWAESLLAPARLNSLGLVRTEPVRRAWEEHLEGTRNWQYPLWTVLMLQAWRERWA
jgi:asparagine synthase (glutamine-hydrolysing)